MKTMKNHQFHKILQDDNNQQLDGRKIFPGPLIMFLLFLLVLNPAYTQTAGKWRGFNDTDWNNSTNWDDGSVPDNTIDVVVPSGCTNYPYILKMLVVGSGYVAGDIYRCKSLEIQSGANIMSQESLWVNGTMTVAGLYLYDNQWLSGTHIINSGGSMAITSSGSVFIGQYLGIPSIQKQDLIVNSGGTLSNAGYFTVNDCLIVNSGATFTMTGNYAAIMGWEGDYNSTCPASFYVASGAAGGVSGGEFFVQGKEKTGYYAVNILEPTFDFTGTSKFTFFVEPDQASPYPDFSVNTTSGVEFRDVEVNNQGALTTFFGTMKVNNDFTVEVPSSMTLASGATLNIANDMVLKTNIIPQYAYYATLIDLGQLTVGGDAQLQWSIQGKLWHLVSSPVNNETSSLFNGMFLQEFSETTNQWTDITSINQPLNVMEGYAAWFDNDWWSGIYFTGDFNTGTVGSNNNLTKNNQGWNLVGNPYPSSIDWEATSGWTKTNLNTAIYLENNGNWATYNGGVGTNGGSRYIAPCHGFFVQANAHPATLIMTNDVRVHNKAAYFKNELSDYLRLRVVAINGYNDGPSDELVIRIHPDATEGFDGKFDAHKLFAPNQEIPQVYCSGHDLAINALPEIMPVMINFRPNQTGGYKIQIDDCDGFANVYLTDNFTGAQCDLIPGPYFFDADISDPEDRFILEFKAAGIIYPNGPGHKNPIKILSQGSQVNIILTDEALGYGGDENLLVRVCDILGRDVAIEAFPPQKNSSITINSKGVYIITAEYKQDKITVKTQIF